MNEVLLSNQVIVFLLSESVLYLLLIVAFAISLRILKGWDFGSFSPEQFRLERYSYLVATVIMFAFIIKALLVVYFVFTIDDLSSLLPGAMCGAGVIASNDYGPGLLILKLVMLFCFTLWLYVNRADMSTKNYRYLKEKYWVFLFLFILLSFEIWLDFSYFLNINTHLPVSCCSALFGQLEGANPLPFGLSIPLLLALFYLLFALIVLSIKSRQRLLYMATNLLFIYVAYYAVVYFFGTYIYELPTHKCPFCMLQKEYGYVGYLIWSLLFVGTFVGISDAISALWLKRDMDDKADRNIIVLFSLFVIICTAYVAIYYLKNGVLL